MIYPRAIRARLEQKIAEWRTQLSRLNENDWREAGVLRECADELAELASLLAEGEPPQEPKLPKLQWFAQRQHPEKPGMLQASGFVTKAEADAQVEEWQRENPALRPYAWERMEWNQADQRVAEAVPARVPAPPEDELREAVEKYLGYLNSDQPLNDEFKMLRGAVVTLACNVITRQHGECNHGKESDYRSAQSGDSRPGCEDARGVGAADVGADGRSHREPRGGVGTGGTRGAYGVGVVHSDADGDSVAGVPPPSGPARQERQRIRTRCPSCGHDTLFIGAGDWLVCSWLECKHPGAINDAGEALVRHVDPAAPEAPRPAEEKA